MAVLKVPFDATRARPGSAVSLKSAQAATGIATDCLAGKTYWTDTTGRMIR